MTLSRTDLTYVQTGTAPKKTTAGDIADIAVSYDVAQARTPAQRKQARDNANSERAHHFNILDFANVVGDGVADDTAAIQAAIDFLHSRAGVFDTLYFPAVKYRTSATLIFKRYMNVVGDGAIIETTATDAAVQVGVDGPGTFFQGRIEGITLRALNSCDYGWVYTNCSEFMFVRLRAENFGRGHATIAGYDSATNSRVAYGAHYEPTSIACSRGFTSEARGVNAYTTECSIYGGRFSQWTERAISLGEGSLGTNNYRLYSVCAEGNSTNNPSYNIYLGRIDGCVIMQPRIEGTVVNPEGNSKIVCSADSRDSYIICTQNNSTFHQDPASVGNTICGPRFSQMDVIGTDVGHVIRRNGSNNANKPLLELLDNYSPSGDANGIKYLGSRGSGFLLWMGNNINDALYRITHAAGAALSELVGRSRVTRTTSDRTEAVVEVSDEFSSSGDDNIMNLRSGRGSGNIINFERTNGTRLGGVVPIGSVSAQFQTERSDYNFAPLKLGDYYLWVDTAGRLRINNGIPTGTNDGAIVGSQV